jgi:hypothetical protein
MVCPKCGYYEYRHPCAVCSGCAKFEDIELDEDEEGESSPLHEILMIADQLPAEVLKDINQRIGDWLAMGGKETDEYIEQQLRFARRFVQ